MKVTNEKTENSQAFLTIEMEPAEVEESLEKSYHRLVQKVKIPGFRKGKAPRSVLERYVGREGLLEDTLNILVPEACDKAIKEQAIEAFAQPQVEVTTVEPMVFKAVVPLKPKVKLGDYRQIKLTPEPVEVTDVNVDAVMEQLRHQRATWEPVERALEVGDLATLDMESSVEAKPFINRKGAQYQVTQGLTFPAPGFGEQLVGMKKGEEKEFTLQFPAEYPSDELAGKEVLFKVKVTETKREVLPELNDDFAKAINPEYPTLASLSEAVAADLKARAEEKARLDFEERALDAVVAVAEVEFPPVLEETEVHRILNQRFQRGRQEMDDYLRSIKKTEEELHEELHPIAAKRVARSLVLGKIIEDEKIEATEPEIDAEIENMVQGTTDNKEELKRVLNTPEARGSIAQRLLARKAIQHLLDIVSETKTEEKKGDEK